jgi:hypothetical protein
MAIFLPLKIGPAIRQLPTAPTTARSPIHVFEVVGTTQPTAWPQKIFAQTACVKNFHRGRRDEFGVAMNALDKLRQD